MNDWKKIYGPVPASFEKRVQDTLAGLEQAQPRTRRTGRRAGRTMLIAAALAAVLSVSALAAGLDHFGLFDTLFGTGAVVTERAEVTPTPAPPSPEAAADGTVTQEAYEYTWADGTKLITSTMPGFERTPVDEALAEELIGPYVQELDKTYTLPNEGPAGTEYEGSPNLCGTATVTFLSYVQDEAGTGYLYFSVENPNGLDLQTQVKQGYTLAGDHAVHFNGGSISAATSGGRYFLLDTGNTTDTKAYIGLPIAVIAGNDYDCLRIEDIYGQVGGFNEKYTLRSDRLVPAVTGQGQYVSATVSPMGARLETAEGQDVGVPADAVVSFAITMADGSEYPVRCDGRNGEEPTDNTTYLQIGEDGSMGCCFNRIIDTAQIASVTVTVITGGNSDDGYTFETDTIEF